MAQIGRCLLVLLAALAVLDTADSDPTMAAYCDLIHMWTCEDFSVPLFWAIPKTGSRHFSQTFISDVAPHPDRHNASVPRYCVQPKYSTKIMKPAEVHRWPLCKIMGLASPKQTYIAYPGYHPMTHMARHTSNHFVTMLREPADRVLSELFHCLYGKSFTLLPNPNHRPKRSAGPDGSPRGRLDRSPGRDGLARIGPSRRLLASDVDWPKLLEQGNHPRLINSQLSFLSGKFLTNAPVVGVDASDLAAVTKLVESGRLLVGVIEMFEESVHYFSNHVMLKDAWVAGASAVPRTVVTKKGKVFSDQNFDKPPSDQIPGSVVLNLTAVNALDCELYSAAARAIWNSAGTSGPAR